MTKNKLRYMAGSFLVAAMGFAATTGTAFAGESSYMATHDNSYFENFDGSIQLEEKIDREYQDIKTDSITNTTVHINTSTIKNGKGDITFKTDEETSYKNVEAGAIADVKVDIFAPIIYGNEDELNVTKENNSSTVYDNTKAPYVYNYQFDYNHPIHVNSDYLDFSHSN